MGLSRGFTSRLSEATLLSVQGELSTKGTWFDPDLSEVMRTNDTYLLERFKDMQIEAKGTGGRGQFINIQLDNRTMILIPASKRKNVIRSFSEREGDIRSDLAEKVSKDLMISVEKAHEVIENYLKKETSITIEKDGSISENTQSQTEDVRSLVQIVRVLDSPVSADMGKFLQGKIDMKSMLGAEKNLKMDSPRGGKALNSRLLNFAKEFMPRFLKPDSEMRHAYKVFAETMFDTDGNIKKHRTVNVFDESNNGAEVFNSTEIGKILFKEQIIRDNPEFGLEKNVDKLNERINEMMVDKEDFVNKIWDQSYEEE